MRIRQEFVGQVVGHVLNIIDDSWLPAASGLGDNGLGLLNRDGVALVDKFLADPQNPRARNELANSWRQLAQVQKKKIGIQDAECFHTLAFLLETDISEPARREHLRLDKDAPTTREVECCDRGNVVALPFLGGLHHGYMRLAA